MTEILIIEKNCTSVAEIIPRTVQPQAHVMFMVILLYITEFTTNNC